MDRVALGRTGIVVSRLALGTGTHGWGHRSEQTDLGVDGLASLLRLAYEHGVSFWDAADQYGSHRAIARALQDTPREQVVIATKTSSHGGWDVTRDVDRFRKELGTDMLDIVLLHYMTQGDWAHRYAEAIKALSQAKERGAVRAVGVSCHGLGALRAAAETEWVDVVLARINHAGINMDGSPSQTIPLLERAYSAGKGVYGMKVLGCGQLVQDTRQAMGYVLRLGTVHAMTIGMSRREHLVGNAQYVEELAPSYPLRSLRSSSM